MRSVGDGHGEQGEIPDAVDLDDTEEVGTREVSMDYPEERETETVARLCPYCERPYSGMHGVLIHLGQVAGRKDHPEELPKDLDPMDFTMVEVDEHDNIVEVIEEGGVMPSTERRREKERADGLPDQVEDYIETLRAEGKHDEADRAEEMLAD
jgi:hypothetical protein